MELTSNKKRRYLLTKRKQGSVQEVSKMSGFVRRVFGNGSISDDESIFYFYFNLLASWRNRIDFIIPFFDSFKLQK